MEFSNKPIQTGYGSTLNESAIQAFQMNFAGTVLRQGDLNYDQVRKVWNGMIDKKPGLIAQCKGQADIVSAVNFARENKLLVAVRGGGHNVSGSGVCEGGLMIDLSLMNGVWVDAENRRARVQGGAIWADLDRETQVFGLATPGGVVSTTGVAGLALGGGIGWLRNKYGLTLDNLISADIVTADGQVRKASMNQHEDLFWAIRGGGGNFGVVSSFEFELHPVGPIVPIQAVYFDAEDAARLLPMWWNYVNNASNDFCSNATFWSIPPVEQFFPDTSTHGKRTFSVISTFLGDPSETASVLDPIKDWAKPLATIRMDIPYAMLNSMSDAFFPAHVRNYYFKSTYLRDLDEETLKALLPKAKKPIDPNMMMVFWTYGGAMKDKPEESTAFIGRNEKLLFSIDAGWDDPSSNEVNINWIRSFLSDLKPYASDGFYVNFPGLGEDGEKMVRSVYGHHFEKLQAIKGKYDPDNLFQVNQNIPPK